MLYTLIKFWRYNKVNLAISTFCTTLAQTKGKFLRMCCSFYWYLPIIQSSPSGYPGMTTTFLQAKFWWGKDTRWRDEESFLTYDTAPFFLYNPIKTITHSFETPYCRWFPTELTPRSHPCCIIRIFLGCTLSAGKGAGLYDMFLMDYLHIVNVSLEIWRGTSIIVIWCSLKLIIVGNYN